MVPAVGVLSGASSRASLSLLDLPAVTAQESTTGRLRRINPDDVRVVRTDRNNQPLEIEHRSCRLRTDINCRPCLTVSSMGTQDSIPASLRKHMHANAAYMSNGGIKKVI